MYKLQLSKDWLMKTVGEDKTYPCTVPMTNFSVLLNAGVVPDYNTSIKESELLPYAKKDYEFSTKFVISDEIFACDKILIEFEALDTIAEITINDIALAKTENAHIGYQIDIKGIIKQGNNTLSVIFRSPINYITSKQKLDPMPHNNNGLTGVPHIRKPQCHTGWDWGPTIPFCGITRNVNILGHSKARLVDVEILQKHSPDVVRLDFKVDIEKISKIENPTLAVTIVSPIGKITVNNFDKNNFTLNIDNPILWSLKELNGLAKQPLYEITVELLNNNVVLDKIFKKIGLRTIELNQKADAFGQNFQFVINGTAIFAKGANWIPADSLIDRVDAKTLEYYVKTMQDSNMNMVRVWGGGYYESDEFYNLCDEYGILVWQDFAFACAPYPFYDKTFLDNVLNEVTYNVLRLRHHASLALWCGNNEIEAMTMGWRAKVQLVKFTKTFFYDILPTHLKSLDNVTPYTPGSPIGHSFLSGMGDDKIGDTHLWSVWHGLQPLNFYRTRYTRFCSEFGLESLPSNDAIDLFATEQDYSLSSPVFMAHQKCMSGNKKMLYYMATKYNVPYNFVDLPYYTGLIQAECVKDATEHWRRNRGRCNGSLYWQLNDCWLVSSWASIDYLGKYKALQYHAKHFFNPTMVSIKDDKTLISMYVINDMPKEKELCLKYSIMDFNGKEIFKGSQEFTIAALESKGVAVFDLLDFVKKNQIKNHLVVAHLYENGILISRKTHLPVPDKTAALPKTHIKCNTQIDGKVLKINLVSSVFARSVCVDIKGLSLPFNDNYFDMLPKEEKTIEVTLSDSKFTEEYIKNNLSIKTVANIDANKSKIKNLFTRLYISLIPMNVINRIVYKFM